MTEKDEDLFSEAFKELAAEGYFRKLEAKFMPKAKTRKVPGVRKKLRRHAPSVTVKVGKKSVRRQSRNVNVKKHTALTDK